MLSVYYNFMILASTYGSGAYDTGNYNGTGAGASTSSGSLSNTGLLVAAVVTTAAVILLAALVVRIWKRPSKKQPEE